MQKTIIARILDLTAIGLLLSGNENAQTFCAVLAGFMATLMMFGVFAMNQELAEKLKARSWLLKALGVAVQLGYVFGLIFAGYPVVAACYAIAAVSLRAATHSKLQPQEQH